ncbi:MAG: MFS transporter [Flavobacteriaceae bacterium]
MNSYQQGLRENLSQFLLLVLVNGFVGGMIGIERSIIPELAVSEFNITAKSALLSFIVVFGITKAFSNLFTGLYSNRYGRKRLLVVGWIIALPVPFLLIYAPNWNWVIGANILLGINQGLTWSSTVIMKIDLVGPKNRGFAMGINESIGYVSVGLTALLTGVIAGKYGIRPYPFYLGIGFSLVGLLLSLWFVRDTKGYIEVEQDRSKVKPLSHVFSATTWQHPNLGSITQAGLINNLNDAMVWGIFPLLLASKGFGLAQIGKIVAIYPMVWGLGQLITGKLGDHMLKKRLLFWGMLIQGFSILGLLISSSPTSFALVSCAMGVGTAIVYPNFMAAIADDTDPVQRPSSLGIFRLWRDLGYAFGAILTGWIADRYSIDTAVLSVGLLTVASAVVIAQRMNNENDSLLTSK